MGPDSRYQLSATSPAPINNTANKVTSTALGNKRRVPWIPHHLKGKRSKKARLSLCLPIGVSS
ncbi:hypothetical protein BRADI_5g19013v3 [Brachypodium distachyon]|uniref:Uncharacterized protein n=1 Tax=Brachypodium distachyon TaxID=15368 RepID=A0A2K2CI37_BRADI|nr:hypothetical protein BRADI_5g19013v3 [Brachypodium distachyon]